MNIIGLEEHGLANFKLDVVEEESDKQTDIIWELALKSEHQIGQLSACVCGTSATSKVVSFILCLLDKMFVVFLNVVGLALHQAPKGSLQSLLVLGSLVLIF
jgi:hypothetical protein